MAVSTDGSLSLPVIEATQETPEQITEGFAHCRSGCICFFHQRRDIATERKLLKRIAQLGYGPAIDAYVADRLVFG